jgi:hypothetical protein
MTATITSTAADATMENLFSLVMCGLRDCRPSVAQLGSPSQGSATAFALLMLAATTASTCCRRDRIRHDRSELPHRARAAVVESRFL